MIRDGEAIARTSFLRRTGSLLIMALIDRRSLARFPLASARRPHHGEHRSLLACCETKQPTGCVGCQQQAHLAGRLADDGKSLAEIRIAFDKEYGWFPRPLLVGALGVKKAAHRRFTIPARFQ
jgi:hypothetical protein